MNLIPSAMLHASAGSRDTVSGIRPEHLVICEQMSQRLSAEVIEVETIGDECLVHAKLGESELTVRTPKAAAPRPGETIGLDWATEHLHLFDAASGKRL